MLQKAFLLSASVMLCSHSPATAQAAVTAVGCWHLSFSPWRPSLGGDSLLYSPLPDTIRLSPQRFDSVYRRAARRPNVPPDLFAKTLDSLRAFWRPLKRDSLEVWLPVWWSTGIRVRLSVHADSLHGTGWVYVDYSPYDTPYSTVSGGRCDGA